MKIVIGEKTYTKIKSLSFDPETDIIGNEIAINEFNARIYTDDNIPVGVTAKLYDDIGNLWAQYWLIFAEKIDIKTVEIRAQSYLVLLDRKTMPPKMYENMTVAQAVQEVFSGISQDVQYSIDTTAQSIQVSGYTPEQTARERLHWLCFTSGLYVQSYFSEKIELKVIEDNPQIIERNKTFWKPSISYDDLVTGVSVTAYSYEEGEPQTVDKWVQVGDKYYIQSEQVFTLANPYTDSVASENVIKFENIYLVNNENVADLLSRLSMYYFIRTKVSADIINNAEIKPADSIQIGTDDPRKMIKGTVKSCSFSFGLQARSRLEIVPADEIEGGNLIIRYLYQGNQLDRKEYLLPIGYQYRIQNPFLDMFFGSKRRIYRPLKEAAEGTLETEGQIDNENYDIALEHIYSNRVLRIYSVDEMEQSEEIVRVS